MTDFRMGSNQCEGRQGNKPIRWEERGVKDEKRKVGEDGGLTDSGCEKERERIEKGCGVEGGKGWGS